MSILKKILEVGATAGATVAAMEVAEKYQEEKNAAAGGDINGDGQVDINDTIAGVTHAAQQVYTEAAQKVAAEAGPAKEAASALVTEAKAALEGIIDEIKQNI